MMTLAKRSLMLLSVAILAPAPAWAEGAGGGEGAIEETGVDQVVVTGRRISEAAVDAIRARREAPNPVTVIDAAQLNQFGDQPLGDALRRVAGVSFGGANRAREIQLRGLGVEYTQVLVNGRPLIDGNSKRTVQVDRIPSSLVARVEVIQSPLAAVDGQGASGTVNIILKNRASGDALELGVGGGYLDKNGWLGDATLAWRDQFGPLSVSVLGGVQRQRRSESKDTLNFGATGAAAGGSLQINEREFDQINLTPAFALALGPVDTLRFEPSYLRTREDRDDIQSELQNDQLTVRRREVEKRIRVRENYGLFGAWEHALGDNGRTTLSLDYQSASEDTGRDATRYTAANVVDRTRQRTEDVSMERINPVATAVFGDGPHRFSIGADFSRATRDENNTDRQNGVALAPNASRIFGIAEHRTNAFAQDIFTLNDDVQLTVGARLEHSRTRTRDALGATTSRERTFLLPSAHLSAGLGESVRARLSVAHTVRRPDLRELSPTVTAAGGTVANPDVGGNPLVAPESIWGVDAALERYFAEGRGMVSASLFARDFNDKIEAQSAVEAGRVVQRPVNAGDGWARGAQIDARVPLDALGAPRIALWGNASYTKTRLTAPSTGQRRRFIDQPDAAANLGVDAEVPSLATTFGLSMNWNSGYRQTILATNGTRAVNDVGSTIRVDASARVDLNERMTLSVSALNLFAPREDRRDDTLTAAGLLSGYSTTTEPTYRTFYVRLQSRF